MKKLNCTLLLTCIFMLYGANGSYLFINGSFTPVFVNTPYLHAGVKPPFNVTSFLIPLGKDAAGLQNCTSPDPSLAPFMPGAIVMVSPENGCSLNQHALVAQKAGAAAVLVITYSTHLFAGAIQSNPGPGDLKVPVVFMELADFNKLVAVPLSQNLLVIMKVEGNPSSEDRLNKGGMIFYVIIFTLINLAGLVVMGYKIAEFIKNRSTVSIALSVFILCELGCLFDIIYLFDPWNYFHAIGSFTYIIVITNFMDYFATLSILMVSFHLSNLLFKTTSYSKFVVIAYISSGFLILGYTVVLIMAISYYLTFSYGKLRPNSIEGFRLGVFSLIAVYFFICMIIFIRRLLSMLGLESQRKDLKKSQYTRLIASNFGIWFVCIMSITYRGLFLRNSYLLEAKPTGNQTFINLIRIFASFSIF
eukprot:TRINITY_DN3061_c0_g2_i4.p1 TRINITY_DN3061_c0_g2~~TRINITY_DN3061_c0_g2_i4.p1  ORF type:complete len:425 (+),score=66.28 TRINITY_DN3061_c0_g2_i4:23-1276(+)